MYTECSDIESSLGIERGTKFGIGCADFSSKVDLIACESDNSSDNDHAVLAIFVVLHIRRDIVIKGARLAVMKSINECDVWQFFGDTKGRRMIMSYTMRAEGDRSMLPEPAQSLQKAADQTYRDLDGHLCGIVRVSLQLTKDRNVFGTC
jgi:hypothetical protein